VTRPKGVILDIDGTILRSNQVIPGAGETIAELRRRGHPIVFITNALESPAEQADRLAKAGVVVSIDEIITAPQILEGYLRRNLPEAALYVISDPPLAERLELDFHISEDPEEIEVVIVSCDRNFDFHKLNIGFQALRRGAKFFAVNADAICPLPDGEIPDAGAVIGALQGCSKRQVDIVFGKPSRLIAEAALERLDKPAEECLIIGDSLDSDLAMGFAAGMTTVLVLSGVTQRRELAYARLQPDHVLGSISEIFPRSFSALSASRR